MKRTVAAGRVNGVAYNLPQSRSLVRLASQLPTRSSSLLIAQQPRLLASSAFPASVRFTSRRGYSAQAAPQDFSEEEKEIAKQRQQGAKSPAAQASVNQRRIEELFISANGYVSEEKWTQAEDKLSTILDLQSSAKADDTLLGRVLINLAFVEQNVGKREKAEKHYEEGIATLKKTLGEDHHEVARGLLNYAEVLAFLSKVEQAEAVSRQAIPIFEKNYGPKSELVGTPFIHSFEEMLRFHRFNLTPGSSSRLWPQRGRRFAEQSRRLPVRAEEARRGRARAQASSGGARWRPRL